MTDDLPEKPTMAAVWEELDVYERALLAQMIAVEQGQMSLAKISTVLKAVVYRYHDYDIHQLRGQQMAYQQAQHQHQIALTQAASHSHPLMNQGSAGPAPGHNSAFQRVLKKLGGG